MGGEWQIKTLGNIAQNISRPFNFTSHEKVVFINTSDVLEGRFLHNDLVSKTKLPGQAKKRIQKWDILFSEIRPGNKRYALVNFNPDGYVVSTKFMVIRLIDSKVDFNFFFKILTSQATLDEFQYIAESRSGTFPQITFDVVCHSPFSIPPLPEQKKIAHILGSLDDKIELNRQMNATLEGMAQALFKSWFVDFDPVIDNALSAGNPIPEAFAARAETRRKALADGTANRDIAKQFPAAFKFTEEMGWIPEGWKSSQLHTLIDLIGGGTPKTSIDKYWNGNIPWFSVVDAPKDSDVFVIDTDKKITELGLEKSSTKILREGSTIISARGTVGKCALVGKEMAMNQSCYGIHGANGIADIYTYYTIRQFVSDLQHRGHGSVFNTITRDTFKSIYVPFGKVELTCKFDQNVNSLVKRIRFNLYQNTKLTNLRDTLLPKLISGEIRISEAEKLTEEALV